MTLTEHITQLFKSPDTVESLTDAVGTIELALGEAWSTHAKAQQSHDARAIEFVGDTAAADKSRAAVDAAAGRVADMMTALENARTRLRGAQEAQQARADAQAWENARSLLLARSESIQRLQVLLDQLALEYGALLTETEAVYAALPVKPRTRPPTYSESDLRIRVQLYLFGASSGHLGEGMNAHLARMKPDLVHVTAEADALVLQPAVLDPATT